MKKTISTILVCVLLVGTLLSLASCEVLGMVIGTYSRTYTNLLGQEVTETWEFSGKEVTKSTTSTKLVGEGTNTSTEYMEYEIGENEDGEKIISLTVTTDNKSTTTDLKFNSGNDDGGSYIEIGGVRYYSVK
jgi:hypothetical protein